MAERRSRIADAAAAAKLQIWLSPSFPVGSFGFSQGLETAAATGLVRDAPSLQDALGCVLQRGSLRNDLILLASSWRGAMAGDGETLAHVNDLALALQPSAERHLETVTQGGAFRIAIASAYPCPTLALLPDGETAYPIAVAIAAAGHAVPLPPTLQAYAVAALSNLCSAAIRLSLIGQTDALRIQAALSPEIAAVAADAEGASLDDIGGATFALDLASLAHETQTTRLFRS